MRILVIVMGVVSLFFFFFLVLGIWLFFVGWVVWGFLDFFGDGGRGKVCIRKRSYPKQEKSLFHGILVCSVAV